MMLDKTDAKLHILSAPGYTISMIINIDDDDDKQKKTKRKYIKGLLVKEEE